MTRLSEVLNQITTIPNDPKVVMDAEQWQPSVGHINGSQLQRITGEKSPLLVTLDYFEQQRHLEHDAACSANDETAERWQTITKRIQHLYDLDQHNDWLLKEQIERNQQAIQMPKPHQEPALHGANSQTSAVYRGGKKFSI